jgi:hypothetical protein
MYVKDLRCNQTSLLPYIVIIKRRKKIFDLFLTEPEYRAACDGGKSAASAGSEDFRA